MNCGGVALNAMKFLEALAREVLPTDESDVYRRDLVRSVNGFSAVDNLFSHLYMLWSRSLGSVAALHGAFSSFDHGIHFIGGYSSGIFVDIWSRRLEAVMGDDTAEIDADKFAAIVGGTWNRKPGANWRYRGLCWHSDAYLPGRVILARSDGFRYGVDLTALSDVVMNTAVIICGDRPTKLQVPVLHVNSIYRATRQLAAYIRAETNATVIAFTGSVGKTSSCHLLCELLSQKGSVTTNGQYNYPDGIACETANFGEVDYAVIEASLQGLGEATTTLSPNVAVLTNLSPVHIDLAGSLLALADMKARLFKDLAPGGTAVINRDIAHFDHVLNIARQTAATVLTFGEHVDADFRLTDYDVSCQWVKACVLGQNIEYQLGLHGHHMALNSLGVLAAIHAAGANWKSSVGHLVAVVAVSGRGKVEHLSIAGVRITLIDDAYNASPAAMEAAFTTLETTASSERGRPIAVLADMLELGDDAVQYHRQLGKALLKSRVDKVYLAGELVRYLWQELPRTVRQPVRRNTGRLLRPLIADLRDGDVVLFKGSHGTNMHKLVADIRYLSLMPHWGGAGVVVFVSIIRVVRRLEPYAPLRAKKWLTWQLAKLSQRKATHTT